MRRAWIGLVLFVFSLFVLPASAQNYPPLPLNRTINGRLSQADGQHWYAVTVPSAGRLQISARADGNLTISLRFFYQQTTLSFDESGTSATRSIDREDLDRGVYFVRVTRTGGEGNYFLDASHAPSRYHDEPTNNTQDTALQIPLERRQMGRLGYFLEGALDTVDWYKMTIVEPGHLLVSIQAEETLKIQARFFDVNGSTNLSWDESGSTSARKVEHRHLLPGTYFLRVTRSGGHGGYEVLPAFTAQRIPTDREPNDQASTAQALSLDREHPGILGYYRGGITDTVDWFMIETRVPGHLVIDVEAEDTLKLQARLFDTNASTTLAWDEAGTLSKRQVERRDLLPGTYYVRLTRSGGYGGYSIVPRFHPQTIASDKEPNDTHQSAEEIVVNKSHTGLLGYYSEGRTDTTDFFLIRLQEPGALKIEVEGEESLKLQLRLFDSNMSALSWDEAGTTSTRSVTREDLREGTYYLRVARSGGFGGYTIYPQFMKQTVRVQERGLGANEPYLVSLGEPFSNLLRFYRQGITDSTFWHTVRLPQGGPVLVHVAAQDPLRHNLRFFTSQSAAISWDESGTSALRLVDPKNLTAGDYLIRVSGTGGYGRYSLLVTTATEGVQVHPHTFDFGPIQVGAKSHAANFGILNLSASPVPVQSIRVTGADAPHFQLLDSPRGSVQSRGQLPLKVVYEPKTSGSHLAVLEVVTTLATLSVPLRGVGFTKLPSDFGGVVSPPLPQDQRGALAQTEKTAYAEREAIRVQFTGLPGNQGDWIALAEKNSGDSTYLQWHYAGGQSRGELSFSGLPLGEYEVRVFFDWPNGGHEVHSRYSFQVMETTRENPFTGQWVMPTGEILVLEQSRNILQGTLRYANGEARVEGTLEGEEAQLTVTYRDSRLLELWLPREVATQVREAQSRLTLTRSASGDLLGVYEPWLIYWDRYYQIRGNHKGGSQEAVVRNPPLRMHFVPRTR